MQKSLSEIHSFLLDIYIEVQNYTQREIDTIGIITIPEYKIAKKSKKNILEINRETVLVSDPWSFA